MNPLILVLILSALSFSQGQQFEPSWKLKQVRFIGDTIIEHKYRVEYGADSSFAVKTAVVKIKARNNGTFRIHDTTFRRIRFIPASEVEE